MELLIIFSLIFLIVFIVYYMILKNNYLKNNKKKKKKKNDVTEILYLVSKFKLKKEDLINKKMFIIISLLNAFIISIVCTIIFLIDTPFYIRLIIGFVLLFALIYALYELLGRYLVKVGSDNEF